MYKALIVDDEPIIMDGLSRIIRWKDYGVSIAASASDGYEALSILEKEPADLIITDIKMPGMDGLQLIQSIRERGLHTKIIILSGYDDFIYVKKAATLGIENYLLKPIEEEELSATVQHTVEKLNNEKEAEFRQRKNDSILRENILFRWMNGNISESELENRADFLGIRLDREYYLVCIVHVLKQKNPDGTDQSFLPFAVQNICAELLEDYCSSIVFNSMLNDTIIIFSGSEADFRAGNLESVLGKVVGSLESSLNIDSIVTVGSRDRGHLSASVSYKRAYDLLNYRVLYPANAVISYYDIKQACKHTGCAIKIDYKDLKSAIYRKDIIAAQRFLDEIYRKVNRSNGFSPEPVKSLAIEILYNAFGTLDIHQLTDDPDGIYCCNPFEVLSRCTLPDLFDWLKKLVAAYIRGTQSANEKLSPVINSILKYVDRNYGKEISLKTLSETYHINAAYLGQLFKRETGEFFSGYLNRYRIGKAKDLLKDPTVKESDIVARVGYTNINYFSNLFKKVVGIYPSEYRSSHTGQLRQVRE